MPKHGLTFDGFDATDFEEFCFQLLDGLEAVQNTDWRKGTPKQSSPADRGRDIVAEVVRTDMDGSRHVETWFVDCKHYAKGVPPEAVQGLLAWAHAERPDVALVAASGYLSNACKDYLRIYEQNNRPPFRVRYWERPILDKLTRDNRELLERFLLGDVRPESEVVAAEQELFDRVWYQRHLNFRRRYDSGEHNEATPEIYEMALNAAADGVRERLGEDDLGPYTDFEWGMINGKLSALRWVLGGEWDFLDT